MIEIIPAIDIIEGKCVRLNQGDFLKKKIYSDDPVSVAKNFEAHGLKRVHVVDLDGAKIGKVTNLKVLEKIAAETNLEIDFGGGIKTDDDLISVFNAGGKMAGIGSIAVKEHEKFCGWLEKFGSDRILLGADVKNGKVAIDGWQTTTDLEILPFLKKYYALGVHRVFVTDVSKDGLLEGSAKKLYADILEHLPRLQLIASGGVDSIGEIVELEMLGCSGVIIGKAIYEDRISLSRLGAGDFGPEISN
ncbi:MAG: 1-(5-phosphoribosyl)-5-[(5-phosphoribosylamino)methylideneamino]imidazole-4-carboxamide isomerase [Acidobacteria bacterium]|nr:1-(5-phosphoribosyl)-5-[(5-phosphoribosylamino)methylideneamino]imidazole-4-carboxamide isomerase [Acidobacteriota bacterium]